MKSTISTGVYTIPMASACLGNALVKKFSYSSVMIRCLPSGLSIPVARRCTLS